MHTSLDAGARPEIVEHRLDRVRVEGEGGEQGGSVERGGGEQLQPPPPDRIEPTVDGQTQREARPQAFDDRSRCSHPSEGAQEQRPSSAATCGPAGPPRIGSRSTSGSSGVSLSANPTACPSGSTRVRWGPTSPRRLTSSGFAASSPLNSPVCHCRASIQHGSAMHASNPSVRLGSIVADSTRRPAHVFALLRFLTPAWSSIPSRTSSTKSC